MSDAIRQLKTTKKVVALTLNTHWSGPPARFDSRIFSALQKEQVPATLLLTGIWARCFPKEVSALVKEPLLEIGNHSWDDKRFSTMTEAQMRWQMEQGEALLKKLTGKPSRYFRPPLGESSKTVERVAESLGMQVALWSVDGSSEKLLGQVVNSVRPGSVIALSLNGTSWKTGEQLGDVIRGIKAKGYDFVKLDGA
jgi:peptidoglycan/xylan/chitin deacetylase (PgdA/CDA1 family)